MHIAWFLFFYVTGICYKKRIIRKGFFYPFLITNPCNENKNKKYLIIIYLNNIYDKTLDKAIRDLLTYYLILKKRVLFKEILNS